MYQSLPSFLSFFLWHGKNLSFIQIVQIHGTLFGSWLFGLPVNIHSSPCCNDIINSRGYIFLKLKTFWTIIVWLCLYSGRICSSVWVLCFTHFSLTWRPRFTVMPQIQAGEYFDYFWGFESIHIVGLIKSNHIYTNCYFLITWHYSGKKWFVVKWNAGCTFHWGRLPWQPVEVTPFGDFIVQRLATYSNKMAVSVNVA